MTALAWMFLVAWVATMALLAISSHANQDLAAQVHQLRRRIHPSGRGRAA